MSGSDYEQRVREEREQRERMLAQRREEQRREIEKVYARRHRQAVEHCVQQLTGLRVE